MSSSLPPANTGSTTETTGKNHDCNITHELNPFLILKFNTFLLSQCRLVCKFEGTQIVLDDKGVEYQDFKNKFTGESFYCIEIDSAMRFFFFDVFLSLV